MIGSSKPKGVMAEKSGGVGSGSVKNNGGNVGGGGDGEIGERRKRTRSAGEYGSDGGGAKKRAGGESSSGRDDRRRRAINQEGRKDYELPYAVIFSNDPPGGRISLLPKTFTEYIRTVVGMEVEVKVSLMKRSDYLVGVSTAAARDQLLAVTEVKGRKVAVNTPKSSEVTRETKGVIYNVPGELTMDKISAELEDVGVTKAESYGGGTVVLHFQPGSTLPRVVELYQRHRVASYLDKPRQCWKCYGFYHHAADCKSQEKCLRCGGEGNRVAACTLGEAWKCANCNGDHRSGSKDCPAMQQAKQVVRDTQQRAEPWLTGHGRETCLSSDKFPPLLTKEVPAGGSVKNSSASAGFHRGGDSGCCAEVSRLTALVAEMVKDMKAMKGQLEQLARNTQRREETTKSTPTREQMAKNPLPRETPRERTANRETPSESTENREALSENTQNREAQIEHTPKNSSRTSSIERTQKREEKPECTQKKKGRRFVEFTQEEYAENFARWSREPKQLLMWEAEGRPIPSWEEWQVEQD